MGHDEGGTAWGRIASLIETCKLNGVEPFAYPLTGRRLRQQSAEKFKSTLEALAQGRLNSDIDALLPWNFTQEST